MTETGPVLRVEPDADADPAELTYTFGGAAPVATVRPGTLVSTWTMDCFAGRVRSTADLVSQVCDPRYINPQTGPFYVDGARPGDTLAVHFRSITPRGVPVVVRSARVAEELRKLSGLLRDDPENDTVQMGAPEHEIGVGLQDHLLVGCPRDEAKRAVAHRIIAKGFHVFEGNLGKRREGRVAKP